MPTVTQSTPGFFATVRLLLVSARRRSRGRIKRQRELLNQRTGRKNAVDWSRMGVVFAALFMAFIHGCAAFVLWSSIEAGQRLAWEQRGKIIVNEWFYDEVANAANCNGCVDPDIRSEHNSFHSEARQLAQRYGGSESQIEQKLRDSVRAHGADDLVLARDAAPGIRQLAFTGPVPILLGSLALLWWIVMLVFQGEGLELDIQRRRHPLWEWLFSHPVPPSAVFLAEILSPLAANPMFWSAPLFPGAVYGLVYGPIAGLVAAILVGVPITIAAACLGKAIEIGVMLRCSTRTRGAVIGFMSWIGYSTMMLLLVAGFFIAKVIHFAGKPLAWLSALPWPWLQLFLGGPWSDTQRHGSLIAAPAGFHFLLGIAFCWTASLVAIASGIAFTIWGTERGLAGATSDIAPSRRTRTSAHFGRDPLYRKEFLWFLRDRSAIVQTILIPLTVAGFQLFNLRGIVARANGAWNYLCGAAILFGTYFLWILGPKSLLSEGQALWIALTWPRGIESLLKAKAWLWSLISSGMVALVLGWAVFLYPAQAWKIGLVAVGWFFFARSMAEKSVTLVTVPSSSGEAQKIPWGRRSATQLGMLTFAIGVFTQQWNIAVMGIVFSYLTAAAMWQNFRARLPFLYDPWSEKLPPPPTLMHAMVAISLLIESGAILVGGAAFFVPHNELGIAQAVAYAIAAGVVFLGTAVFLHGRGVESNQVWTWQHGQVPLTRHDLSLSDYVNAPTLSFAESYGLSGSGLFSALGAALAIGLALGLTAHGYAAAMRHIPSIADAMRKSDELMRQIPSLRLGYAIMAVGIAPFAEEYLFRGLLYRALDREWGGWRAVVGAAAFFVVYHPLLAWPPVFLLGATNCLVFKKTGRLVPCILLHITYNAVVLLR
ncbi:MAG TPA: CPBP family intramembrane glutamic endopeptidase [Acidobacteriaceae bacterium]|nr:CPBP family intramembrane glutamic endopeptidase [Acidobacteriaceae bacterium]